MLIYGSSADVTEAQVVHLQELNAWMRDRFRRTNGLQAKGQWKQELRMKDQFEVHRAPKDMPPKAPISFTLGDMKVKIGPFDPTKPFNLPLP
ncbi:hypothetical protein AAVH_25776 [Aphelenchoides avenae]|nr:hypothetical protein AAVH_25776 [Aphelenchus avenae]